MALPVALFFITREKLLWRPLTLRLGGTASLVQSVVFSSDGSRVAAVGGSGHSKVWDAHTGQMLLELAGARGYTTASGTRRFFGLTPIRAVIFSPDGAALPALHADGKVRVWSIASGKVQRSFSVRDKIHSFQNAQFSFDGRRLVVSTPTAASMTAYRTWLGWRKIYRGQTQKPPPALTGDIKVYNVTTGRLQRALQCETGRLSISEDGMTVASAGSGYSVTVNDGRTGKSRRLLSNSTLMTALDVSPDGQAVAAATFAAPSASGAKSGAPVRRVPVVMIWETRSGRLLHTLQATAGIIQWRSLRFSSDGKTLAAGGFGFKGFNSSGSSKASSAAQLWDTQTGKTMRVIETNQHSVEDVVFSPDGKRLATGSFGGTLMLWRLQR